MEKTTLGRPLFYDGKFLGYLDRCHHIHPALTATETQDFLTTDIDIGTRIHLRTEAPNLYRLAHYHGLRPRDYITPFEAGLWAKEHMRNKRDLQQHAPVAWRILHRCGLEDKVFPELQPA